MPATRNATMPASGLCLALTPHGVQLKTLASPLSTRRIPGLLALTAVLALAMSAGPGHAEDHKVYASLGLPGLTVGYAYTLSPMFGVRADVGTTGSIQRQQTESGVDFDGTAKYNRVGLFGDWFPFSGGFRLTGGLTLAQASLDLKSNFTNGSTVDVNGITVATAPGDYFNAKLKYPSAMPYLGIGWGHQGGEAGLGFSFDLGVSIGKPKMSTDTNLLDNHPGIITQADIDAKTEDLRQSLDKISILPAFSIGLNYRF